MNRLFLLSSFILWTLISSGIARAEINSIVTFGDSLSDPGNFYHLFGEQEIQPFEPENVAGAPYAIGGHKFSNGKVWIEWLTQQLGIPQDGSPAAVNPTHFKNYAVGRSRARSELLAGFFSEENLTSQVTRFLQDNNNIASGDATYIIWIGSNDVSDALGAYLTGQNELGGNIMEAAMSNTLMQIARLLNAGAQKFVILNIPDFSLTPRVKELARASCQLSPSPEICQAQILGQVSFLTSAYNGGFQFNLFNSGLPVDAIEIVDISTMLQFVVDNPESHGFENVDEPCLTPNTLQQVICTNQSGYLYFDGIHPTKAGHMTLAEYVIDALGLD